MSFFQRSLKDMISGMRANRQNEAKFIQNTMEDIKKELKHKDLKVKSVAMQKLTYLNMLGFDMTWAAFHVVEVMSTHKIAHKVIGYHAASQSFNENTEVMLLITNLLKKDLQSQSPLEQSIALDCLSNIVTLDLARDLVADVYGLLSASSVPSRKRSALVLYCCFLKYPDALRPCFKGLTEHLDDHDQGVVSSVICVLCELVIQHPHNYLEMAPLFYKLLLTSSNNWMTIKLLKIFGALTPLEPRLTKKLAEPLKNIMASTMAKSLLYECIYTVCSGMTSNEEILHMALEHLKDFVLDSDPNLKYLGFRALEEFVKRVPDSVTQFGNAALQCLSIIDPTIRSSALRVISGLVDKDVVKDVITHMLRHIPSSDTSFRNELSESILTICRRDKYALVPDFSWYLDVLVELARVLGTAHGKEIAFQINDIACRVEAIRDDAVQAVRSLLIDPSIFEAAATRSASRVQNQQANLSAAGDNTVWQVLQAAAWITGEYATFVEHPKETIEGLLQPGVLKLPDFTQSVYIQATLKVFVTVASDLLSHNAEDDDEAGGESGQEAFDKFKMVTELADLILSHLDQYMQNDPEAMERACQLREILNVFKSFNSDNDDGDSDGKSKQQREDEAARFITHLAGIISEDLEPVSSRAQRRIAAPSELSVEGSVLGQFADVEFDKMNAAGMDDESVDNASEFSEDTAVSDGPPGDAASVLTEASSEQKLRSQKHARDQLKQHREKHNVFYLNKPQQQEQQGFTDSPPEQGKSSSFASGQILLLCIIRGYTQYACYGCVAIISRHCISRHPFVGFDFNISRAATQQCRQHLLQDASQPEEVFDGYGGADVGANDISRKRRDRQGC